MVNLDVPAIVPFGTMQNICCPYIFMVGYRYLKHKKDIGEPMSFFEVRGGVEPPLLVLQTRD